MVRIEQPVLEAEPNVINEKLIRSCTQIAGRDPESVEEKKRTIPFAEVEDVSFSFRSLAVISNLQGLVNLVKLQLDNNMLEKIENLGHLTRLTWLDLSFNNISKIEGLETLTNLTDLSLFNNQVEVIENLDTLQCLQVLSMGNNALKKLNNVMYLRQFKSLRIVKLEGNPICKDPEYRSYILSHISQLTYFDYRRVSQPDVTAALEQHQDEMIEIQEKEENQALEEEAAAEKAAHEEKMRETNLEGVETLMDTMVKEDAEWQKLSRVPGLLDGWNDIRDKFNVATEEFKNTILEQYRKKKSEHEEFETSLRDFLHEKDTKARQYITEYEKMKKEAMGKVRQGEPGEAEYLLLAPKAKLVMLKQQLMDLEQEVGEALTELCHEFEGNYMEITEANKGHYNTYFAQVRDLENTFASQVTSVALQLIDKFANDSNEVDKLEDDVRTLLGDKDLLINALQASHDGHTSKIDTVEDKLVNQEVSNANDLINSTVVWEARRSRERVSEIVNYVERNMMDLEEAQREDEAGYDV
ncbi:unnamed protein product [Ostreobium quekettii]|uniref:Dynein regulatory complex subunit 3 n=1 Tax=Ostreobium quekettii TaxID=121088 RepID=A0A8S1JC98_9CHLO|nr:unnamed protein product [Ostreobium quekettii]|eukprot:evm.model.scf_441EXC.16 EVM.evm.TU.scf_441EXC.16   scf_441EXC:78467-82926(+)